MKFYLKDGNTIKVNDEFTIELLNVDEFVSTIKDHSKSVPAPHFKSLLNYKIIYNNSEFNGSVTFDSHNGITSTIDKASPYTFKVVNLKLADNSDYFIEFYISKK